jgi:riboflavin kinase
MDQMMIGEKEWFLLFHLAKFGAISGIKITTQIIADKIDSTQQTVSRHLKTLIDRGLVQRDLFEKTPFLKITDEGLKILKQIQFDLSEILNLDKKIKIFKGKVQTGMGEGAYYIKLPNYFIKFREFLGDEPFLGTLNVLLEPEFIEEYYLKIERMKPRIIDGFQTEGRTFGPVNCYNVELCPIDNQNQDSCIKALILDIRRTSHKRGTVEIVSCLNLRKKMNLTDGSFVGIQFIE